MRWRTDAMPTQRRPGPVDDRQHIAYLHSVPGHQKAPDWIGE